jgi:hypothetical protein
MSYHERISDLSDNPEQLELLYRPAENAGETAAFQQGVESLPTVVQNIIYETPDPILLKCLGSDPIYLLDDGEKRWIDTIDTFEERGYVWRDVHFIRCDDLRAIPDGEPIPPGAGPPPQP